MRPETARRNIEYACRNFYSISIEEPAVLLQYKRGIALLVKYRTSIEKMLELAIREDRMLQLEYTGNYVEPDMYYSNVLLYDAEEVMYTLFYVSDRYNCVGRLKWLLALVGYYEKKEVIL